MGIIIKMTWEATEFNVPCLFGIPDAMCADFKMTGLTTATTTADGKSSVTMKLTGKQPTDKAIKDLMAESKDGMLWVGTSNSDGKIADSMVAENVAGAWDYAALNVKCSSDIRKVVVFSDAKSLLNNALYKKYNSYNEQVLKICKAVDTTANATNYWRAPVGITNPSTNAVDKTISVVVIRNASDDGKDGSFKLSDKYQLYTAGFTCTTGCKKITTAMASGWFDMPVTTAGASTLLATATIVFGALSLF